MQNRRKTKGMGKDPARGARSGRNIKLTVTISEEAAKRLEAEIARRNKGSVKKTSKPDLVDEALLAHLPPPVK
jgi:hypothetical protein